MQWVIRIGTVVYLFPAFSSPFFSSLSELPVSPLPVLLVVFVDLCLRHVASQESPCVTSVPPVRLDYFVERRLDNVEVVHSPDVPVANFVKFNPAHVGAIKLRDNLSVLLDFSADVVATLPRADCVLGSDSVRSIFEVASAA